MGKSSTETAERPPPPEPPRACLPPVEIELERCTGHCCRAFPLGWDGGLAAHHGLQRYLRHKNPNANGREGEGLEIAAMILPLVGRRNAYGQQLHTCRHLEETPAEGQAPIASCAIYETRPNLCSKFPYGQPCTTPGCTRRVELLPVYGPVPCAPGPESVPQCCPDSDHGCPVCDPENQGGRQ